MQGEWWKGIGLGEIYVLKVTILTALWCVGEERAAGTIISLLSGVGSSWMGRYFSGIGNAWGRTSIGGSEMTLGVGSNF